MSTELSVVNPKRGVAFLAAGRTNAAMGIVIDLHGNTYLSEEAQKKHRPIGTSVRR